MSKYSLAHRPKTVVIMSMYRPILVTDSRHRHRIYYSTTLYKWRWRKLYIHWQIQMLYGVPSGVHAVHGILQGNP